jgi:DNA-directed RNA polymerase subunit RPC12/RpoP
MNEKDNLKASMTITLTCSKCGEKLTDTITDSNIVADMAHEEGWRANENGFVTCPSCSITVLN